MALMDGETGRDRERPRETGTNSWRDRQVEGEMEREGDRR